MRISIHGAGNVDALSTSKFKVQKTISMNGEGHEVSMLLCTYIVMHLV